MISTSAIRISCVDRRGRPRAGRRRRCTPPSSSDGLTPAEVEHAPYLRPCGRIVGATGQVGGVMRTVLAEREFPVDELRLFASARSAGRTLPWNGDEITVEDAATADYAGLDLALFSAGATDLAGARPAGGGRRRHRHRQLVGLAHGPRRAARGARGQRRRPRPIPKGIVANPNCTTMVAMPVLKPLHLEAGLEAIVVSTYQAVSGGGLAGVGRARRAGAQGGRPGRRAHLRRRRGRLPRRRRSSTRRSPSTSSRCRQLVDDGRDETDEEQKLRNESRKILGIPDLPCPAPACGCRCSPATRCRSTPASRDPITPGRGAEVLPARRASSWSTCPRRSMAAGNDPTYVGRIRPTTPSTAAEASRCSAPATTCARAPPSTPSRSPSSSPPPAPSGGARREAVGGRRLLHGARRRALRRRCARRSPTRSRTRRSSRPAANPRSSSAAATASRCSSCAGAGLDVEGLDSSPGHARPRPRGRPRPEGIDVGASTRPPMESMDLGRRYRSIFLAGSDLQPPARRRAPTGPRPRARVRAHLADGGSASGAAVHPAAGRGG